LSTPWNEARSEFFPSTDIHQEGIMQTAVVASLDEEFLKTETADSDRFVYCNYVMPLRITFSDDVTPILPDYTRKALTAFVRAGVIDGPGILKALPALDFGEVISRNRLELKDVPHVAPEPTSAETSVAVARLDDANELLTMIDAYVSDGDKVVARAARAKISEARSVLSQAARHWARVPPARAPIWLR